MQKAGAGKQGGKIEMGNENNVLFAKEKGGANCGLRGTGALIGSLPGDSFSMSSDKA